MNSPAIDPSDVVSRSDRVIVEEVGGETVVLDLEGDTFLRLNSTGAALWNTLAEPKRVGDLAAVLERAYDLERPTALQDTTAFVADLRGRGLLTLR